ncbi:MAG: DUF5317 domain-containing protein [Peptococcaceae bacterium]|nr:DUF5317 domain-containing protein [Peptococcaceae bacterium]
MAFAIIILAVAALALLTGGKARNLKNIRFSHSWLVLLAVAIKVITNSGLRYVLGISDFVAPKLYISSLLLITIFILANIRLRGLLLVGAGLLSNLVAIVANAGYMPVKREYLIAFASPEELEKISQGLPVFNHIPTGAGTKFYYLTDIFLMPHWILITKVFSIGDVLITAGAAIFVWTCLRPARPGTAGRKWYGN